MPESGRQEAIVGQEVRRAADQAHGVRRLVAEPGRSARPRAANDHGRVADPNLNRAAAAGDVGGSGDDAGRVGAERENARGRVDRHRAGRSGSARAAEKRAGRRQSGRELAAADETAASADRLRDHAMRAPACRLDGRINGDIDISARPRARAARDRNRKRRACGREGLEEAAAAANRLGDKAVRLCAARHDRPARCDIHRCAVAAARPCARA